MRVRFPCLSVVLVALGANGCGVDCTLMPIIADGGSNGTLFESESRALAALADGGNYGGETFENAMAGALAVNLAGGGTSYPMCIAIWSANLPEVPIYMECPPSAGTFSLADLQATACDESGACGNLAGTVTVQQFTPPCNDYSCGSIHLTLNLSALGAGGGPYISGTASAWVTYGGEDRDCSSSGAGLGDLD
jgi:hypothetical protein